MWTLYKTVRWKCIKHHTIHLAWLVKPSQVNSRTSSIISGETAILIHRVRLAIEQIELSANPPKNHVTVIVSANPSWWLSLIYVLAVLCDCNVWYCGSPYSLHRRIAKGTRKKLKFYGVYKRLQLIWLIQTITFSPNWNSCLRPWLSYGAGNDHAV